MLWLKDKHGKSPLPIIKSANDKNLEQKKAAIAAYHDKTICCSQECIEDEGLRQRVQRFQQHTCTFSCHKKKKTVTLQKNEGHKFKKNNSIITGPILENIPVCRYKFPRLPMDKTEVLIAFQKDEDEKVIKAAKKDYLFLRKYLLRQTHDLNSNLYQNLKRQDFRTF